MKETGVFTYGSLCTGYDGIGQGISLAGLSLRHLFCAEVDPSVTEVLKVELPGVPNVGDIKALDWSWRWPEVDVLSSGDPCQSISVAGRREGREDPRFLWPWVMEAVWRLRPRFVFLENVANMVAHDGGRTMAERFENLRNAGYAVRWTVIGACAVGAPHHRHRWFALAARMDTGVVPEAVRIGMKAWCGAPRSGGRTVLPSPRSSDHQRGAEPGRRSRTGTGGTLFDACALLPTPMSDRSGNNRGGGSGREGQPVRPSLDGIRHLLPTPRATDGTNGGPGQRGSAGDLAMPSACQPEHWGRYAEAVTMWEQITGVPAPAPTTPGPNGGVRLNPELPEWMMGLPPGLLTQRMSRNEALKAAGNGVVPLQAAAAWRMLSEGEVNEDVLGMHDQQVRARTGKEDVPLLQGGAPR